MENSYNYPDILEAESVKYKKIKKYIKMDTKEGSKS